MAERRKIFLAYSYPDKKWLDRVQAALTAADPDLEVVSWDDRKLRGGKLSERELARLISGSRLVVMLVSDLFIESEFIKQAKLPSLLNAARAEGLHVCWVLVSHCLYETAGINAADALNDLDWPLDGLSVARREAVLSGVARKINALASGQPLPADPRPPAEAGEAVASLDIARLAQTIEARQETAAVLRHLAFWLAPLAWALFALSIIIGFARGDLSLLFSIAGFGIFVASLRQVVKARLAYIGQSIVSVRCVKTGLADDTLPDRQRGDLLRRTRQILGEN